MPYLSIFHVKMLEMRPCKLRICQALPLVSTLEDSRCSFEWFQSGHFNHGTHQSHHRIRHIPRQVLKAVLPIWKQHGFVQTWHISLNCSKIASFMMLKGWAGNMIQTYPKQWVLVPKAMAKLDGSGMAVLRWCLTIRRGLPSHFEVNRSDLSSQRSSTA